VLALIHSAKQQAMQAVNTRLIELYWQVGAYISRKLEQAEWGDAVVSQLVEHLAQTQPGLRGFTRSNLFRMRKFYETYRAEESRATGATIILVAQPDHFHPKQAPRGAGVLFAYGGSGKVVEA